MKIALLLLEVVIGYSLVCYLWLLGVMFFPVIFLGIIEVDIDSIFLGVAIAFGGLGLWGVLQLTIKILEPEVEISSSKRLKLYLLAGYAAAAYLLLVQFGISLYPMNIVLLLPLLVTLHLIYETRAYLWVRS